MRRQEPFPDDIGKTVRLGVLTRPAARPEDLTAHPNAPKLFHGWRTSPVRQLYCISATHPQP